MGSATSGQRFRKCVQCGTPLIFFRWSENSGTMQTDGFRHCPVCGHGFSTISDISNRGVDDAKRLEEFFSKFS